MRHFVPPLVLLTAFIGSSASAQLSSPHPFGTRRVAVGDDTLARVRGGFAGAGLNVSFGIDRAVFVDGVLLTTTRLNATGLGGGHVAVIQSGVGNSAATGAFAAASIGTVVQNTLDGQKIQSITTVDATVNSLNLMRGMNLVSSLRGAVIDSLRR